MFAFLESDDNIRSAIFRLERNRKKESNFFVYFIYHHKKINCNINIASDVIKIEKRKLNLAFEVAIKSRI